MLRESKLVVVYAAVLLMMACSLLPPGTPSNPGFPTVAAGDSTPQTTVAPAEAAGQTAPSGTPITFPGGSLIIPTGLASGATVEQVAAVLPDESQPWWNVAPAHVELRLQGYALQGKFHDPLIVVYPAEEYAAMNEGVASNLNDLRGLIANPAGATVPGAIPGVPFFNAGAVLNAQTALVSFSGGQGIRSVTQYSQFYSQVNNAELFYVFHGLTTDGKIYIVVILPTTASLLAADGTEGSAPPAGGVPFPGFEIIDPTLFESYYRSVTDMLNATPGDQFQPALATLDELVQSFQFSQ